MQVEANQTLLQYRVIDKVGEGGMGVVWRAIDTTLGREVAIKVLPDALAMDPDRLARFEREARLLASLNHPSIAEIYGLHAVEGTRFIAMELVNGEDLSQRLERGPLSEQEALDLSQQIAAALEAAHEQGVIHRDLKPANVMLGPNARVKVLDFGLAKAYEQDPASRAASPSMSPTMTSARTIEGMILGTAAYMAPEQARGQSADKRADIWALGCILFESLSGQKTFAGDTISDTLAAVLKIEPEWEALPNDLDPRLRLLIARCLEKDSRQRLRDIGEARIALDGLLSGNDSGSLAGMSYGGIQIATGESLKKGASAGPSKAVWLAYLALVATLAGSLGWWIRPLPQTPDPTLRRFDIVAPGIDLDFASRPVLSPDGKRIAYVADDQIWIRDLEQFLPQELPGSKDAGNLSWSPDGNEMAWLASGKIWRSSLTGGSKSAICDAPTRIFAITWGPDDRMILTPDTGPLFEVSARGGDPRALLEPVAGQDEDFHNASFLPVGRGLIFSTHRFEKDDADTIEVLVDGKRKEILQIEDRILGMPQVSPNGYLVYVRFGGNDGIWAAPFSLDDLELTGEPVLIDPLGALPSLASDGSLLYFRGENRNELQMVWVDREGREIAAIGPPQDSLAWPAVSPDGKLVAVSASSEETTDIWIHDTVRGSRTRLTFAKEGEWAPAWFPDGLRLAFGHSFGTAARILSVPVDRSAAPIELAKGELPDVSPDGASILFEYKTEEADDNLYYANATSASEPTLFLATALDEEHAQMSPDGRYVAYSSEESGRGEIYLMRFPDGVGKWQVSISGGNWARWNPNGREIFFLAGDDLMVVDVILGETPQLGTPETLFSLSESGLTASLPRPYDVDHDGSRFVMLEVALKTEQPSLTYVQNWTKAVR